MAAGRSPLFATSSRSCRMTISRISVAALLFALISSGALAQSDDEQAPPPQSDSSREQPPYVDTSDLKSDEPESDQPQQDQPPPSRERKPRPANDGRDVSTDG